MDQLAREPLHHQHNLLLCASDGGELTLAQIGMKVKDTRKELKDCPSEPDVLYIWVSPMSFASGLRKITKSSA
jgi:hypothetical protein